jgi:hypothetical protein
MGAFVRAGTGAKETTKHPVATEFGVSFFSWQTRLKSRDPKDDYHDFSLSVSSITKVNTIQLQMKNCKTPRER